MCPAIMNKAAVSLTQVFWWPHAHICLGNIFRGGSAGPGVGQGVALVHRCACGALRVGLIMRHFEFRGWPLHRALYHNYFFKFNLLFLDRHRVT